MTADQNAAALIERLKTALDPDADVYDLSTLPSPRPSKTHVEVSLSRRFGGNPRLTSRMWPTGYRVTLRAVSESGVDDVRAALEVCRADLEYQRLTVGAQKSTPIQFETEDAPEPDNGAYSGLIAFTYVIRD